MRAYLEPSSNDWLFEIEQKLTGRRVQTRAIACRPLKVRRLGSLTPARYSLRIEVGDRLAIAIGQRNNGINCNTLGVHRLPHADSSLKPHSVGGAG